MIDPKFERIRAVRLSAAQKKALDDGIAMHGYDWGHGNFDWLKEHLKKKLREKQFDRCCYCRRYLRYDKGPVEIEHVIHKGQKGGHPHFSFTLKNLALACKDCNNGKGTKTVLRISLPAVSTYPSKPNAFLWVHPYMHDYSDHILIHQAWVYEAKGGSPEGLAVIKKCKLALLGDKERANRRGLIESETDILKAVSNAVSMVSDVGLDNLCKELSPSLSKLMGSSGSPIKAEKALRRAYQAVMDAVAEDT